MNSKESKAMTFSEASFWAIHIYQDGDFQRAITDTFTRKTADLFCQVFNGGKATAVAVEVRCPVEVAGRV